MPPLDDLTGAPTATLVDPEHAPESSFSLAAGTRLGRYVVVDRLGAGGMGAVYVAYDTQLARRVAIKVLRPGLAAAGDGTFEPGDAQARLLAEAQTMARLAHPNVAAVHDVGAFGDGVFVAMEYVEGQTLRAWLKEPKPWREVLSILVKAGRGLEAAHAAGIVHRDFKPANVFLGNDGRVVVGDFGIARAMPAAAQSGASLVPPGDVSAPSLPPSMSSLPAPATIDGPGTAPLVGTVGYMAPEQALERRDDARSDQFSFCVTLYRALYGRAPFAYYDLRSYVASLLAPPNPPPPGTAVPGWVHAVIRRGLAHEPGERFASMTHLLHALEADPTRRRRGVAGAVVAVVLAGTAAFVLARHQSTIRAECAAGDGVIARTWTADARAKVAARISENGGALATDFAPRTVALLDGYAGEWARTYREANEATLVRKEQSDKTRKDRLACLDGEREELGALVDLLTRADPAVASRAIGAAYDLPPPGVCLEPSAAASALPEAPALRARVAALRRSIAEAEALRMTGAWPEAKQTALHALEEARAIPHPESAAELLALVAACEREITGDAAAVEAFEAAFAAAERAGNDSLAAKDAAAISLDLGDALAQPVQAARWLDIAKGIRAREGTDERTDAEILEAELSLTAQGHPDRTIPLRDELVALLARIYGSSHPRLAAAIANRAGDLDGVGRLEEAAEGYARALAMQERVFGERSPYLSVALNNLASVQMELGRYAEAKQSIERALAVVAPLGADNAHNILPLVTLAQIDGRMGDVDGELSAAERSLAIESAGASGEVRYLPAILVAKGEALLAKGDAAGARDVCARALALQEERHLVAPDLFYADDALTCAGDAEIALGKIEDAIAHLERGVTLRKRSPVTDLPVAEFALARALGAAGRDPQRARALATAAEDELKQARGMEKAVAAAATWLQNEPK